MKLQKRCYGLDDVFYMVCVNEQNDFWNVLTKDEHMVVIATSGYSHTLDCLYKLVQTYRNYNKFKRALNNVEYKHIERDKQKINDNLRKSRAYEEDVLDTVQRAMDDMNKSIQESVKTMPRPILKKKERKPVMKLKLSL